MRNGSRRPGIDVNPGAGGQRREPATMRAEQPREPATTRAGNDASRATCWGAVSAEQQKRTPPSLGPEPRSERGVGVLGVVLRQPPALAEPLAEALAFTETSIDTAASA